MKAWTIKAPGDRSQMIQKDFPKPTAQAGELLIAVKAAGVNRTDIMHRENRQLDKPYPIFGIEVSGEVIVNNSGNERFEIGTRVAGLVNLGGFAEYAVIPADRAIILPDNLSYIEGAGLAEVFLTAYQTLYWEGKLKPQETVLIHAAGSGVGTAATQLAKYLSKARIITTAGHSEKLRMSEQLGASVAINYKEQNFVSIVNEVTNGQGADVILDFIGASYWHQNIESTAIDGRWVLIGTLGGAEVEHMSISSLMQKRLSLKATLLTPRNDVYKAALTQEFIEQVLPLFIDGSIKVLVDTVVDFNDLPEAQRIMETNENIGKIILKVGY